MEETNGQFEPAIDAGKTQQTFAIASRRVVVPSGEISAAIIVESGTIIDVVNRSTLPGNIPLKDYGDLVISPGVVDAHVHINEPGRTEWEGFESATSAAAAGGITTLIDMPLNSSPVTTTVAALKSKQQSAIGKCHVDVGFYGGIVPGNTSDISALVEEGVFGLKAFLCDSGLDEFPASDESVLRSALEIAQASGIPVLAHAEIASDSAPHPDDVRSYSHYMNSRPPEFEVRAIQLLINLCRATPTPIHIVHLATAEALSMLQSAQAEGLPITVETCPHYLYFSDATIEDGDTRFKCAPPIRAEANRVALCKAVGDGQIETIGSDHSPCPPELKCAESGDFTKAWGGISALQLSLSVAWTVGLEFGWSTALLADRLSRRPAEIFGLAQHKGAIVAGRDADLVVWNPEAKFTVQGQTLLHRHKVTPYDQCELRGKVVSTYLRGQLIFDGHDVAKAPIGKTLKRNARVSTSVAQFLNGLSEQQTITALEQCCASKQWCSEMAAAGDFKDDAEVDSRAQSVWKTCAESDFLEAFTGHPRIGDIKTLRAKYANTKAIAGGEQSGVDSASDEVLHRLAEANDAYYEKFGFIFIVCATGKSAEEMLRLLEQRLLNERETELQIAAAEQLKITQLRLRKLKS